MYIYKRAIDDRFWLNFSIVEGRMRKNICLYCLCNKEMGDILKGRPFFINGWIRTSNILGAIIYMAAKTYKQKGPRWAFILNEMCPKETEQWVEKASITEGDNYSLASVYLPKRSCKWARNQRPNHLVQELEISCHNRGHQHHYSLLPLSPHNATIYWFFKWASTILKSSHILF